MFIGIKHTKGIYLFTVQLAYLNSFQLPSDPTDLNDENDLTSVPNDQMERLFWSDQSESDNDGEVLFQDPKMALEASNHLPHHNQWSNHSHRSSIELNLPKPPQIL